jgi:hypothetical protein
VSVDNVSGTHTASKSNDDVKVVNIQAIKCAQIPSGFEKFFKNLEGIFAFSSEKTILVKNDLKSFQNLKYLDISWNRIENLPSDVFEDNLQMEWIDLSDNRLKLIGLDILNPLKKLHYANFGSNRCIDSLARDKTDIERSLKKLLVLNCQPFNEEYTGTTPGIGGKTSIVTEPNVNVETTTKKGFFKNLFG